MLRVAAAAARCRAGAERRAGPVPGPLRSGLGRASQGAASHPFIKTAFRLSSPPNYFLSFFFARTCLKRKSEKTKIARPKINKLRLPSDRLKNKRNT